VALQTMALEYGKSRSSSGPDRSGNLVTGKPIICALDDAVVDARKLMKTSRAWHVLVMESERLVGLLSFSDVLEAILQDADMELHVLRDHAIARRDM
jgi:CBS domain-containing protein